jgi:hypothetical protein
MSEKSSSQTWFGFLALFAVLSTTATTFGADYLLAGRFTLQAVEDPLPRNSPFIELDGAPHTFELLLKDVHVEEGYADGYLSGSLFRHYFATSARMNFAGPAADSLNHFAAQGVSPGQDNESYFGIFTAYGDIGLRVIVGGLEGGFELGMSATYGSFDLNAPIEFQGLFAETEFSFNCASTILRAPYNRGGPGPHDFISLRRIGNADPTIIAVPEPSFMLGLMATTLCLRTKRATTRA